MTTLWFCGIATAVFRVRAMRRKREATLVTISQINDVTDMLGVLLLSGLSTPQTFQQIHLYLDEPARFRESPLERGEDLGDRSNRSSS